MILPLFTPADSGTLKGSQSILAADIGATKTNLALIDVSGGNYLTRTERQYPSQQFGTVTDMLDDFLQGQFTPEVISLGVAGPVSGGRSELTNINLLIDATEISDHFKGKPVYIINDLESTAYGLGVLKQDEMMVYTENNQNPGNAAIIAPGTGLGEAGLYFDGKQYHPFATEGGHCDFAPRNELDYHLFRWLSEKYGHVSWERLVSGPGIMNIYLFLRDIRKIPEPDWLKAKLNAENNPKIISAHHDQAEICNRTMELFIRYLAIESSNLALKHKATGGIYIGGGIIPEITDLLSKYDFKKFFCDSDRMNKLLSTIRISVILNSKAALLGAAFYGIHQVH